MNVVLNDEQDDPLPPALDRLVELTLRNEGFPPDTEVALSFVDRGRMAQLNETHLGRSGPTDVLAFPIEDLTPGTVPAVDPDGPPLQLGDVFICPAYVGDQATAVGVPFDAEVSLMVVHGLLHLLGYDHEQDDEAESMERREAELLALVGHTRR